MKNGWQSKLKKSDLQRLEKMASKPDPPTQASMAKALNVSQQVDRWRTFIISDEAWIYLSDTNAKSKVQYLSRDQNRRDLTQSTTVPHPKGVMVWMGISASGVTKPRFVESRAKINSEYYIQKILKPFLKDDYCRLYPNGDAVIHQDSAPSQASRITQKFLTEQQEQFLRLQK
ncbi:hypothetical protein AVEN_274462-1 [Araneus ventricosus]|uniref:Uncharacterized protein n=1 Tax=Araneus ventricosus TaxID=182803 RepID=A0A4Y2DK17_ARAVE|nr:hypothetical protein AVEN_274462-1 [Araneus ventricosus]